MNKKILRIFSIILLTIFISISLSLTVNATKLLNGDIDNDGIISINDLAMLKLHLIDKKVLSKEELVRADVDGDNKITINDIAKIKRIVIGIENPESIPENNEITVQDTSFKGFEFNQITPTNKGVTFERLNFQTEKQKSYEIYGAGSQWPVSLETSNDGSLMLYGIDVAGMYKSTDHGKTWTIANNGFGSRGVNMFAIDPYNTNHVLALGLGKGANSGIYISYDKAETWKKDSNQVFQVTCARYLWDGLEFDPTTYNNTENQTTDVYFSIPYMRDCDTRKSAITAPRLDTTLKDEQVRFI